MKSLEGKTALEIKTLVPVGHWVAYGPSKTQYTFGKSMSEASKKFRNNGYNGIPTLIQHEDPNKRNACSVAA